MQNVCVLIVVAKTNRDDLVTGLRCKIGYISVKTKRSCDLIADSPSYASTTFRRARAEAGMSSAEGPAARVTRAATDQCTGDQVNYN